MPIKKEPLVQNCFRCQEKVVVKFVPPLKNYAQKNNWGYWTENKSEGDKYICWDCLTKIYYQEPNFYYESIKEEKKRRLLRTYLSIINMGTKLEPNS